MNVYIDNLNLTAKQVRELRAAINRSKANAGGKTPAFLCLLASLGNAINAAPESKTAHKASELGCRTRHFDLLQG
jgi:hypothetical protein